MDSNLPEKALYEQLRKYMIDIPKDFTTHKKNKIPENHMESDYLHILISIPLKYAFSQVINYMKEETPYTQQVKIDGFVKSQAAILR